MSRKRFKRRRKGQKRASGDRDTRGACVPGTLLPQLMGFAAPTHPESEITLASTLTDQELRRVSERFPEFPRMLERMKAEFSDSFICLACGSIAGAPKAF